ncbi:hypothetical protein FHV99_004678 [Ochrobactrum sp. P20RRXII]|nr:minor capsid protein [Ochrobactrum sp. P20RRXII]NIH77426.1 hypothetical protein [Ochrobactrum sp. P20RRXII]
MIMDILGEKLEKAGLGVRAKSIFHHQFPADITVGTFFRYPLTGISVDPYIPNWHKVRCQVIVRHTSVAEGEKMADAVSRTLTTQAEEVFPATADSPEIRLVRFFPDSLPVRFPRLEGNSIEWSMHFDAVFSVDR